MYRSGIETGRILRVLPCPNDVDAAMMVFLSFWVSFGSIIGDSITPRTAACVVALCATIEVTRSATKNGTVIVQFPFGDTVGWHCRTQSDERLSRVREQRNGWYYVVWGVAP